MRTQTIDQGVGRAHVTLRRARTSGRRRRRTRLGRTGAYVCSNGSFAEAGAKGGPRRARGPEAGSEPRSGGNAGSDRQPRIPAPEAQGIGQGRPENQLSSQMPRGGSQEGKKKTFRSLSLWVCLRMEKLGGLLQRRQCMQTLVSISPYGRISLLLLKKN